MILFHLLSFLLFEINLFGLTSYDYYSYDNGLSS